MFGHFVTGRHVVRHDDREAGVRLLADQDGRDRHLGRRSTAQMVVGPRADQESVDPPLEELGDQVLTLRLVASAEAQQDGETLADAASSMPSIMAA